MRPADDRDLGDTRVPQQDLLDLARVDVRPARDDHVLGAVHQGEEALRIEGADIARVQPAVAEGLRRRRLVSPIARHDRFAACANFASLPRWQRVVVGPHDCHLDGELRKARRADDRLVSRVARVRVPALPEARDAHRAFALAVELGEAGAERCEGGFDVGDVHRRAAIDEGLEAWERAEAPVSDQPVQHGGRREHGHAAPAACQLPDLASIETARLWRDLGRERRHVRQRIEARAVRERGRVQN